ncbi:unnamed protein product [Phaedon cochleariae]|uniref:Elongator complex protein 2 n=1 Tax=Phaedon cochleariae TaxID=80249 RepID=A0A9N9SC95_PHACE|nr:unnamed protein product [Phaedon cochleariae]
MKIENCYISSNCNQTPTIAHWGKNNLICYGSCNSVLIYNPDYGSGGKVIDTLIGHSKRVNSVKWLTGLNIINEIELISGSTDCTICVWSLEGDIYKGVTLEGHSSNVNLVDGLYKQSDRNETVLVSISMDCSIRVWFRKLPLDSFSCSQTINLGYSIGLGAKLAFLPNSNELILACSFENSKIQLYIEKNHHDLEFEPSCLLAGHEDWVRGLDFTQDGDDLLLVSSSQDNSIRLWRITAKPSIRETVFETTEKSQIESKWQTYNVLLESILTGHEGWIYSVNWNPKNLQILSASIDKSMIIWEFDECSGLWLEKIRVGEVGGNTLGFYGGIFSPSGDRILAHSYHGAFHIWQDTKGQEGWSPCVTVGGHFSEVVDLSWEPKGEYLLTVSTDQTTRIHAPWKKDDKETTWHEIARPQVHGYDMSCLAVISKYKFVSAAEEKVIRIFEAPKNFVENFERICGLDNHGEGFSITNTSHFGPKGASVPSLGLSNKAVYTDDNIDQATSMDKKNPYPEESHFQATDMIEPPTEETLLQNTLWPETQKLYGHGYEVYSLAASPDGKFLASACRSTKPEHAAILLWDTSNWKQIQKLMSHTLTVVQLQFSPDSNHLLSVSRDRRWSLFSKTENGEFELVATTDKKTAVHSRIIWTCCWSHDSKYFATGSRDGKVVVWWINKGKERTTVLGECEVVGEYLELPGESVTALAFSPCLVSGRYLIAVGFDSGDIHFYGWCPNKWQKLSSLSKSCAHHLTVRKLAFRPVQGMSEQSSECGKNILQLASCSSDYSVKIYNTYVEDQLNDGS